MRTHRSVREVMTPEVQVAQLDMSVKEIAERLDRAGVSALPVLDSSGRVAGVVSESDLLRRVAAQDPPAGWTRLLHRRRADRQKAAGRIARELMTVPAVVISPEDSVVAAARRMERHQIKRLPVVDADGTLVGIVTRGDVIALFTRSDAELLAEIRANILQRPLLLPPNDAAASVQNGVVTLTGCLPRRSDVRIAVELARRTDGVVDVVDELRFYEDDATDKALRMEPGRPAGRFF